MENNEQFAGFSVERVQRMAGAEIWNVRTTDDWEVIGQAFVMYPEYEVCQIMLAVEPDFMEQGDDVLELIIDTLGVDEFVCTLAEWKEDIYSDTDEFHEEFAEDVED